MNKRFKESDIARVAMEYLQGFGWDCFPEAQFHAYDRRADIAAVRDGLLYIVEAKVTFSWTLLEQAFGWLYKAHYVSVAVPGGRIPFAAEGLCREKGIGIIGVYPSANSKHDDQIYISESPRLHRSAHTIAKIYIEHLHEDMKQFTPGTTGSYSTPWTRTMNEIKDYITKNPGCLLKDIMNDCKHHYRTDMSARSAIPKWIEGKGFASVKRDGRILRFYPVEHKERP